MLLHEKMTQNFVECFNGHDIQTQV